MAIYTFNEAVKKAGVKPEDVTTVSPPPTQEPDEPGALSALGGKLQNRLSTAGTALKDTVTGKTSLPQGTLRVLGSAAGAVNDTVGAALSPGIEGAVDKISDIDAVQNFAQKKSVSSTLDTTNKVTDTVSSAYASWKEKHPDAALDLESAGEIASFLPVGKGLGIAKNATTNAVVKTGDAVSGAVNKLRPTADIIEAERKAKITKGFEEQNTRLKSADKSFTKNTITRQTPDGKKVSITPIDTFAKYNIAPVIDKGSIQMGDYKTATGELGKIKARVEALDHDIDTKLVNTGKKVRLEELKESAIANVKSNDDFRELGTVNQNLAKLESRFEDYRASYGDEIDVFEINNIRKTANKDYSPDTEDISRVVGDTARKVVYDVSPDGEIRSLLQKQGELLAAKKYAETINGTKVVGGRLGNMAMRTAGAIAGSTMTSVPIIGPIAGMLGGEFTARALQQSQFKSLWTETRALLQRSNNTDPSQTANTMPSKVSISQKNIKTADKVASTKISPNRIPVIVAPKKSILQKAVDKYKSLPNKQGGFVRIGGKEFKEIPEPTKQEMVRLIDYINLQQPYSAKLETALSRIQQKYNINPEWSESKIASALEKLIEHTKTN